MNTTRWQHLFPTIRSRLLAVLTGCVLLPLIAAQLWMHLVTRRSLEASEIGKYHSLTTEAARQVTAQMKFSERNLRTLSSNHLLRKLETEKEWVEAIGHIARALPNASIVCLRRHPLDTDEVRQHIATGKRPTRLALTWQGRVSFVLTETGQIKKIDFLDVVFEGRAHTDKAGDAFDADAREGKIAVLLEQPDRGALAQFRVRGLSRDQRRIEILCDEGAITVSASTARLVEA